MKIEDEIKSSFRNEYHKGLINLKYTVNQLSYDFFKSLKAHDLSEQQYNVLRILKEFKNETPLSIGFVKEHMLDKKSDISRIVDKLLGKGLVNRKENPKDRRQKAVEITKKGLKLLESTYDCEQKADTLLQNLNPEEIHVLNWLLDKIRHS